MTNNPARFDVGQYLSEESLKRIVLDLRQMKTFIEKPLIITKANGVWYEDVDGKKYLDGISGIFVVNVGHNNRRVIESIQKQLGELEFSPPLHSTNPSAILLANKVAEIAPGDLNTVKLVSSGSEATETAMKMARQYHHQTGHPNKYKVISRYWGFHGATLGALSATGTPSRKWMFEPVLQGFVHVWPPTCYRCPFGLNYPDCGIRCATIIEDTVKMEGPETVAAIILEPIGNTGGIITPPPEYLPIVRQICDRYNLLLIFDEIITGFGRTGQWFAAQTFDTLPDILCMGKGMASGYAPMAAIAIRDHVAAAFWGEEEDNIEFADGHTYGGNPVSCAASLACIAEIQERDLPRRARELGTQLIHRLEEVRELGIVGEVRGKGLLIGVEFVKDPLTKEKFPAEIKFGLQVGKKALEKGLILRFDPDWIAFGPPLVTSDAELDQMMDIFTESVREVLEYIRTS
jgi:adenosylmethionine-8-amino-7-oxononanoate aminotransferase